MAATLHNAAESTELVLWDASTVVRRDNKLLAMPQVNNSITLWDTTTLNTTTLKAHSRILLAAGFLEFIAFSPDGKLMLGVVSSSSEAWLWDTATWKERAIFEDHNSMLMNAAFSPDGKLVATASSDMTAGLWETVTGKRLAVLEHTNHLVAVKFLQNGNLIATASFDGTILIWDVAKRTIQSRVTCDINNGFVSRFLPDGELLATLSNRGSGIIRFWDVGTGELRVVLRDMGPCAGIEFSPDGKYMAVPSTDGKIRLWYDKRDPDLA